MQHALDAGAVGVILIENYSNVHITLQSLWKSKIRNMDDLEDFVLAQQAELEAPNYVPDIPCFMIDKTFGQILMAFVRNSTVSVGIELDKDMTINRNELFVQLWTSSQDEWENGLLTQIAPYMPYFDDYVKLEPQFFTSVCEECKRTGYKTEHRDCISRGAYCAPTANLEHFRSGMDIVMEDLRIKCVWHTTKYWYLSSKAKFWKWLEKFNSMCNKRDWSFTSFTEINDCSYHSMRHAHISNRSVQRCLRSAVKNRNPLLNDSWMMSVEKSNQKRLNVNDYPSVYIDSKRIYGEFSTDHFVWNVCSQLVKKPSICTNRNVNGDTERNKLDTDGLTFAIVFTAVWSLVTIAAIAMMLLFIRNQA